MSDPFFIISNKHALSCGQPPRITNEAGDTYVAYFENREGEQWVFVYDPRTKTGQLWGGDIGWERVVPVRDGRTGIMMGEAETDWLQACWKAATGVG